jgi:hypothetical protein
MNNNIISKTDLLMMAKFIRFNKMTRLGMKNAGNYEMAFYDYLVNFFVQTAKANPSITREQLQESLEREMRKITQTNNRFPTTMRTGGAQVGQNLSARTKSRVNVR